jgi:hypothetical protein
VLYVVVGAASGLIMEQVLEKPVMALRNRVFPPRSATEPAVATASAAATSAPERA